MNVPKSLMVIILGVLISSSSITGCGAIKKLTGMDSKDKQQAQKGEQKQEKPKIGVILSQEIEETPQIKQGLIDAAKKENLQLVFLKDPKKDLEQKGKDLKGLILQGGDEKLSSAIELAAKQKLPIVSIDQVEGAKVDAVVSPNYNRIGEIQADFLKNKLKEGNVVILQASDPGAAEIVSGIKASLVQNPSIKVVQTFTSPTKTSSPVANCEDYLNKNPGKVQAIVATDSKLALEEIENLKKNNQDKKIIVVGAGTHKEALEKVASGDLTADVDKSPYLQGMYSAKLASQLVKQQTADADSTVSTDMGETPAKIVPVRLVVPENLAQFQKTYNQPAPEEEEEKPAEQGKEAGKGGQDKQQGGQDKQQGGQDKESQQGEKTSKSNNNPQSQGSGEQQQKQMPAGVTQVREKIKTEIQREMLGQDGKVMGTETEVKEEVRTLPAALVQAKQEQAAKSSEGKKQGEADKKDSKSKDEQGGSSKE